MSEYICESGATFQAFFLQPNYNFYYTTVFKQVCYVGFFEY